MAGLSYARRRYAVITASVAATSALVAGTWVVVRDDSDGGPPARNSSAVVADRSIGPVPDAAGARIAVDLATVRSIQDVADARILESGRNSGPLRIERGALRHGNPTGTDAAGYLEIPLPGPAKRLGMTVVVPTDGGLAAVVAFEDSLVDAQKRKQPFPYAGIHFVVSADSWDLGVFDPEIGANSLRSGSWVRPDGETGPVSFEIQRSGSTLTVVLPDGRRSSVSDPRVAAWTGKWATWELYEPRPGVTPAAITSLWAS